MKKVALSRIREDLLRYLREARKQEVVITRYGKPVGVLRAFSSDDDWVDYLIENDPSFAKRIAKARADLRAGRGIRLEEVEAQLQDRDS